MVWFKRNGMAVLLGLTVLALGVSLLRAQTSSCGTQCTALCYALDITYQVEGLAIQLSEGRNVFRTGLTKQDTMLTEIRQVPSQGTLGDIPNAAAVLLEQRHGGDAVYYYIAAAVPKQRQVVYGTNAIPLGDRVQVLDVALRDGIIWVTYVAHEAGAAADTVPTVLKTMQICYQDGVLYLPNAAPLH